LPDRTEGDELITRQTDHGILAESRGDLKKLCDSLQLKFVERPFSWPRPRRAKKLFISSATSFVTPVVKIDGARWPTAKWGRSRAPARGICAVRIAGESIT